MKVNRRFSRVLALLLLSISVNLQANLDFDVMDNLPVGEQYRQLTLMLLVAGGADPVLVDALLSQGTAAGTPVRTFDPDAYRTPLTRIVDQDSMLLGSAHMFRFTRDHIGAIEERLYSIEANAPEQVDRLNMTAVTEDAILIRQAIADSIEYSGLNEQEGITPLLMAYRGGTVRLRNVLEYEEFSVELDRLTAEAIDSVGGKLDAYQRMFDDEMGTSTFDRHIDAAEYIYTREFNERAGDLTEQIIENMVLLESQPNK